MKRHRVWFSPCPAVGFRGVAVKARIGWWVIYRFGGNVQREWFLTLRRNSILLERDA